MHFSALIEEKVSFLCGNGGDEINFNLRCGKDEGLDGVCIYVARVFKPNRAWNSFYDATDSRLASAFFTLLRWIFPFEMGPIGGPCSPCNTYMHIKGRNITRVSYKFNDLLLVFHVRRLRHSVSRFSSQFSFVRSPFIRHLADFPVIVSWEIWMYNFQFNFFFAAFARDAKSQYIFPVCVLRVPLSRVQAGVFWRRAIV